MLNILRLSSAAAAVVTGIVLMILWIIAANDQNSQDNSGKYECQGCNQLMSNSLSDDTLGRYTGIAYSRDLMSWMRNNRNTYALLIAFGVIIGILFILTGLIGFMAKTNFMAKLYLVMAIISFLLFVIMFPIIIERFAWVNTHCSGLWAAFCRTDPEWMETNRDMSYREFWVASLITFITGSFVIGSAIYVLYRLVPEIPKPSGI